ncbi:hypothetical protein ZIOFF_034424 [Zingiber officinale]|uniref:Uncharacterized protein n=1 Tax=Zingiber officinale TaxID=94328 RepID=A0A8J5GSE0_ZINOF|nr:hypothetical protein ZIOFF_034424 [Zingiber officinale]
MVISVNCNNAKGILVTAETDLSLLEIADTFVNARNMPTVTFVDQVNMGYIGSDLLSVSWTPQRMAVSGPVTPGQVSFLLGFLPVFIAWLYSEVLEYRKSSSLTKVHSDVNLVELDKETVKDDDRVGLLEGGLPRSSSRGSSSSARTNLIRFISLDESFLLEHRKLLRAM